MLINAIVADCFGGLRVSVLGGIDSPKGPTTFRAINRHAALITLNTANRQSVRLDCIKAITTAGALDCHENEVGLFEPRLVSLIHSISFLPTRLARFSRCRFWVSYIAKALDQKWSKNLQRCRPSDYCSTTASGSVCLI